MNKQRTVDSKVLSILRECPETRYDDMQLILLGQEFGLKKQSMVLLEQLQTVNKDELRDYIGTIEDEQLLRRINITLKKTFGLWIYKEEKKENIRCLCPKCLKDYIHNPDYIVRRLDPFAKVKDHCDKCNQSGWDYVIAERQHNAREKGVSECLRKDMKL